MVLNPMPQVARIEEAATAVDPCFLHTPVVRSEALDRALGREILLKVETLTPIRSFKGRGASWLLQRLGGEAEAGLVCASAGNFGQGLAHAARSHGVTATVFAATGANPLKIEAMRGFGAEVRLEGHDFDAAKAAARGFAAASGRIFVEDGLHPAIAEGAGTIALEMGAAGALGDTILVPLGNGSLVNGIGAWIKARRPATRVVAVVAAGAPAMALSWRAGPRGGDGHDGTIADGVAVRVPVPEALAVMRATVDDGARGRRGRHPARDAAGLPDTGSRGRAGRCRGPGGTGRRPGSLPRAARRRPFFAAATSRPHRPATG